MAVNSDPQPAKLTLPARIAGQSLLGYTHQHIALLESAIAAGIKKARLILALREAGFNSCRNRTFESALYLVRHGAKRQIARTQLPPGLSLPAATSQPGAPRAIGKSRVHSALPDGQVVAARPPKSSSEPGVHSLRDFLSISKMFNDEELIGRKPK